MKRFVIGFAAIIMAIGLNAFTPEKPKPATLPTAYVWFQAKTGKGSTNPVVDADVMYLSESSETPPAGTCSGSSTYNCVIGFNSGQVSGTHLASGSQTIQATGNKRGTQ